MTMVHLIKEYIELGLMPYSLRGVANDNHGGKHGRIQADIVLRKKLRVLRVDSQATRRRLVMFHLGTSLSIQDVKALPPQ